MERCDAVFLGVRNTGQQRPSEHSDMRREGWVTVQGPVKKQQPDGMSHGGRTILEIGLALPRLLDDVRAHRALALWPSAFPILRPIPILLSPVVGGWSAFRLEHEGSG